MTTIKELEKRYNRFKIDISKICIIDIGFIFMLFIAIIYQSLFVFLVSGVLLGISLGIRMIMVARVMGARR